jgi:hypothetical protein
MFLCKFSSFEYNVIPFGLTNASATFQSFMNDIFADVRDEFIVVYLDNILIYSEDPTKHHDHVCLLLKDVQFDWSPKCAAMFDALKTAFSSFPVLWHYDFDKSCTIETDASDFAISGTTSSL